MCVGRTPSARISSSRMSVFTLSRTSEFPSTRTRWPSDSASRFETTGALTSTVSLLSKTRTTSSQAASTQTTSAITFNSVLKLEVDEYIAHRRRKEHQHKGAVSVDQAARQPVDPRQLQ